MLNALKGDISLKKEENELIDYIQANKDVFRSILLEEAGDVASQVQSILEEGNIDLLTNAERIASYVVGGREKELVEFAGFEGMAWAKNDLTLSLKLEWIHALRRTLWILLRDQNELNKEFPSPDEFFELELKINDGIDEFLNNFFISYSKYKDELLLEQRRLVEHLTVPIIPITSEVAVLPLIGKIDPYRVEIIEEKALSEVSRLEIETLILDLSGIPDIDDYSLASFERILSGISMMGAQAIITGIRPNFAKKMAGYGKHYERHFTIKGSLQQAVSELSKDEIL